MEYSPIAPYPPPPATSRGFTAVELMAVVAIVAILAALAAPSFTPLIERWRVRQAAEGLEATMYFARSEAIKRGGNVVIQKLPNGTNGCVAGTTQEWHCGWIVCEDANSDGSCGSTEPVLQRFETTPSTVELYRTSNGASIALNRWGLISGTFIGFNLVPAGKSIWNPSTRGLCISSGGRVRIVPQEDVPCTN